MTSPAHSLVADVGGTNTRVALAVGRQVIDETIRRYENKDHGSLQDILSGYLNEHGSITCAKAAVAIAGPVRDGAGGLTNLNWHIDEAELKDITTGEFNCVLNDLQAQGHAADLLHEEHLRMVVPGSVSSRPDATKLVIGVGTGFNASAVFTAHGKRNVVPSEVGHTLLPAKTPEDLSLNEFLAKHYGYPSVEEALSGRGLRQIYNWYVNDHNGEASSGEIIERCIQQSDDNARLAVAKFVELMGVVFGDIALVHLPFGGIYLIGGMARAASAFCDQFGFAENFKGKGPLSELMSEFSVYVVEDDFAALKGLAAHLDEI